MSECSQPPDEAALAFRSLGLSAQNNNLRKSGPQTKSSNSFGTREFLTVSQDESVAKSGKTALVS